MLQKNQLFDLEINNQSNFDVYYSGYIQAHCQKKKYKKIKRADQILPEVYGTTLKCPEWIYAMGGCFYCHKWKERQGLGIAL